MVLSGERPTGRMDVGDRPNTRALPIHVEDRPRRLTRRFTASTVHYPDSEMKPPTIAPYSTWAIIVTAGVEGP